MLPIRRAFALANSIALLWAASGFAAAPIQEPTPPIARPADLPRLIVLTDIGGDPDDQQSMIRLMLYCNEFQIEGLIASASGMPGELDQAVTRPQLIRQIVQAYGQVRPNLAKHAAGYPETESLLGRIKSGNPQRGLHAIGDQHDTEGSRWIIQVVDQADPRPVNVAIWGGQTDLAQALWRVREDRGNDGLQAFIANLRVYDIGDQDDIAHWICGEFPELVYLLGEAPAGEDKRQAVYRGMYLGGDESLVSRQWMEQNIRHDHGPLGALYPPRTWTAPNPHSAIKEGDTPSWFFFLPHGINDPAHPEWGGWGGRFEPRGAGLFRDATDRVDDVADARATVWRWRPEYQRDFQARLDWCVADAFADANHPPIAVLDNDASRDIVRLQAKPGTEIRLSARGSHDPDGDSLQGRWFVYHEAGTYPDNIQLSHRDGLTTRFTAPQVAERQTIHVVLQIRDNGTPRLSALRRAIITVGE